MKTFTVTRKVTEGLPVEESPFPHVAVGENGRGRYLTRVPLGQKDFQPGTKECGNSCLRTYLWEEPDYEPPTCQICGRKNQFVKMEAGWYEVHAEEKEVPYWEPVKRASVIKTKNKGTTLLVAEKSGDNKRALVLLATPAGFRGRTYWVSIQDNGEQIHISKEPKVKIVAEGYKAQGQAGRMGGNVEFLVIMEPGVTLKVQIGGRLYGASSELLVRWDGEELLVGEPDIVCQASYEDEEGELL